MDSREAKDDLDQIREAQSAAATVGVRGVGWFLVIWGAVWLIGLSLSHFAPGSWLLWVWSLLLIAGSVGSSIVGVRMGREIRYADTGPRQASLYLLLVAFGALWIVLAAPSTWEQVAVLLISFVGFGAATSGILIEARSLVIIGVVATVATVGVYFLLFPIFGLVIGILGGGGMIVVGSRLVYQRSRHG